MNLIKDVKKVIADWYYSDILSEIILADSAKPGKNNLNQHSKTKK